MNITKPPDSITTVGVLFFDTPKTKHTLHADLSFTMKRVNIINKHKSVALP